MNHPPGCNCGWGGGWHGGGYGSSGGYSSFSSTTLNPSRDFHRRYSPSPASFIYKSIRNMHAKVLGGAWTEPNAICPECCQGVYFIKTENGGSIYFDELGPPWPKHVCTKNSEKIIPTIKGVDVLYHEATFLHDLKEMADYTGHSTALEAATIAKKAEVGKLILGHFSNRYLDTSVFKAEAQTVFENSVVPKILEEFKF
jgi:hypothetical protein